MAIRTQRNKPTAAGRCLLCEQVTTCASFTMYENNSGFGWSSAGTLLLCSSCLTETAEALHGVERYAVLEAQLRAAGVSLPRNATIDSLLALATEHGLRAPVADGGAEDAPRPNTLRWWQAKAAEAGVPLVDGMTRAGIEQRIDLWREASAAGIDLWEGMDNEQAESALAASRGARVAAQQPDSEPVAEDAPPKDMRSKSGAAGEVPAAPRGRVAPIEGNLAPS